MEIEFSDRFKSIGAFTWSNIPKLVVITGKNGTGKSQLLELIYSSITQNWFNYDLPQRPQSFAIIDEKFRNEEVAFLRSEWPLENIGAYSFGNLQSSRDSLYTRFTQSIGLNRNNSIYSELQRLKTNATNVSSTSELDLFIDIIEKQIAAGKNMIEREDFFEHLPDKYLENLSQQINHGNIGAIFLNHYIRIIEAKLNNDLEQLKVLNLEKPWDFVNNILQEINSPFRINDPESTSLRDTFTPTLIDQDGNVVGFRYLSSGEKVLVTLAIWILNANEFGRFPKLLLLDEPDAHLHPSMSKQLIDVLRNVLVSKYGVRIIMTTHSPSTIVFTPEDSLFEMSRSEPRISKASSKNRVISLLTDGLVYVGESTKYFLVEDRDDADFYTHCYQFLLKENLTREQPSMIFIPASTNDKSGGKSVVEAWVGKLQSSGLEHLIGGIIDEDSGNLPSAGVFKISRYSIENYIADPIVVYAALMEKEVSQNFFDAGLRLGEEFKLKLLDTEVLQSIADSILNHVRPNLSKAFPDYQPDSDEQIEEIIFTNGIKLHYPQWLLKRRGKTIINELYQDSLSQYNIHFGVLFKTFRKINFIPKDLVGLFS